MINSSETSELDCPICTQPFCQVLESQDKVHGCCVELEKELKSQVLDPELYCKKCAKNLCLMILPCKHIFCGLCIYRDLIRQKKNNPKNQFECALCRSQICGALNVHIDSETQEQKVKISNSLIPIRIFKEPDLYQKFADQVINQLEREDFIKMLGKVFKFS